MVTLAVWAIAIIVLIIYIRTGSQVLFHGFNVSVFGSLNQRTIWIPTPHQKHGCDYCNELWFHGEPTVIPMSAVFKAF